MTCIYYKIKKKNNKKEKRIYYYCSKQKCEINYIDCKNCPYKEYKEIKPIKKRTYKLAKKEKERFSILYNDLDKCCIHTNLKAQKNEVYDGAYRQLSIEYGMIVPLCDSCHKQFHNDRLFALHYKSLFQQEFEKTHSHEEFLKIFKKDYVYLYERMRGG